MIETHAEALQRWAMPYGGAMTAQRGGRVTWLALYGDYVEKGSVHLRSNSLFALRPAMRSLKQFWMSVDRIAPRS